MTTVVNSAMEVLNEDQCRLLLSLNDVGRVAFDLGGSVENLPVSYVSDGSTVVFRTADDSNLMRCVMRNVAFEVDGWDAATGEAWCVVVKGVAHEITAGIDRYALALRKRRLIPLAPGARERWIAVYGSRITGRRFDLASEGSSRRANQHKEVQSK